jgi:hypothetical protein
MDFFSHTVKRQTSNEERRKTRQSKIGIFDQRTGTTRGVVHLIKNGSV